MLSKLRLWNTQISRKLPSVKDDKWFLVAFSLLFWNLHEKLHTSQLRKLVVLQGRLDRSRFGATPWGLCFSFFFSSNSKILWKK